MTWLIYWQRTLPVSVNSRLYLISAIEKAVLFLMLAEERFNHREMLAKDGSVNPDQTAEEQSDLGLHCLPTPICPKTLEFCGNFSHHNFSFFSDVLPNECW